jgi:hypothetical protein
MPDKNKILLRRKNRYSHIFITLNIKIGFQWKPIKALDWNEDGFNFIIEDEISYTNILFKKGQAKFAGRVRWLRKSDDRKFNLEMMLNTFLYEEINRRDGNKNTFTRIVKLIRTEGMIDEKKKILVALNPDIHETKINRRMSEQKQDASVFRYGVRVSAQEWADIVKYALEASSVVDAIDKAGR